MKFIAWIILVSIAQLGVSQQKIIVLGVAQDGGFPHIGCQKDCQLAFKDSSLARYIVSLALVDTQSNKWWLFEATPDMDKQLQLFQELTNKKYPYLPEGIFLTHAHIGHYTGLMFLGREALGAAGVTVYALPKMIDFLKSNAPWSQLVQLENIKLQTLRADSDLNLPNNIRIMPFKVPHRDEFSETAGYKIITPKKSSLFIPDIDKWSKWNQSIIEKVKEVDYAFIDATFYDAGELANRSMNEVPHPFVLETMKLFENETRRVKSKINFIHMNHTNPLLFDRKTKMSVLKKGFRIAIQGQVYQ